MAHKKTESERLALSVRLNAHACPPPDPRLSAAEIAGQGLQRALLDLMRLRSEEEWTMGWALDLEFKLWLCAEGRWDHLNWERAAGLCELAKLTGGWWTMDGNTHSPAFLPLNEWLPIFAAWEAEDRRELWWKHVRPGASAS